MELVWYDYFQKASRKKERTENSDFKLRGCNTQHGDYN